MRDYPARPIADIFVFIGDIGSRGRGQEQKGRGERPQGPTRGGEERRKGGDQERGMERGSDDASDVEMEEEGWGHAPLTASSWGTQ